MARNKHSAALFEVINSRRPLARQARPGLLSSVSGWLGQKEKPASPPADTPPRADLHAAAPIPAGRVDHRLVVGEVASPPPRPAQDSSHTGISLDPHRREVRFNVTYTSAIIAGFALATLVGVAFLAGQKMTPTPRPALAPTSDELRHGEPAPQVADLTGTRDGNAGIDSAGRLPDQPAGGTAPEPAARGPRNPALNYVLMQSYPAAELKMAQEAVELLRRNNIDCTIENDIPGWRGLHVVVGTMGFTGPSKNPELDAYIRKIKQISDANNRRNSFKAFQPMPFKWRGGGGQ